MKVRILACVLLITLCVCQMPVSALTVAVGTEVPLTQQVTSAPQIETTNEIHPTENSAEIKLFSDTVTLADSAAPLADGDVKTVILKGMIAMREEINISEYGITPNELHAIVQDLLYGSPMVFHLASSYQYSTFSDNKVYAIYPGYTLNTSEYQSAMAFCEEQIEKILETSGARKAKNDLFKALLLHDYIAAHFEYDTTYQIYDIYGMLKNGKAVCQGYALLYKELLYRVGIESGYAHSAGMNHIWNLVKIDDEYYHVDVTWADPVTDRYSRVSHAYFLLSDEYIQTADPGQKHYGWTASDDIECKSTKYDYNTFTYAESSFVLCGDDLYFINYKQGKLCRYTGPYTKGEVLCDVSDYWMTKEQNGSYWPGTYSGLVAYGANLYYNTADTLGMYNVITKQTHTITTLSGEENQIIGMRMDTEGKLCYAVAPDPYTAVTSFLTYEIPPLHDSDINGDGVLNVEDLSCILCYLAGVDENPLSRPDANRDGILNVSDLNTVLVALATAE